MNIQYNRFLFQRGSPQQSPFNLNMQNVLLYILLMAMSAGYALKLPTYDDGGVHYKPRSSLRRGPARSHQRTHQDSVGSVVHRRFREPYHNGHKAYGTKLTSRTGRLLRPRILPQGIVDSIERVRAAGMKSRNDVMKYFYKLREIEEFLNKVTVGMNRRNAEMDMEMSEAGDARYEGQGQTDEMEDYEDDLMYESETDYTDNYSDTSEIKNWNTSPPALGNCRHKQPEQDRKTTPNTVIKHHQHNCKHKITANDENLPKTTSKVLMLCQDSGIESLIREIMDEKKTINKDNGRDSQCSEGQTDGDRIIELALTIPANKEKDTDFDSKQNNSPCIPDEFRRTETEVDIVKKVAELMKPVSSTVGGWMISLGLRIMEEVGKKGLINTIKGIEDVLNGTTTKEEEAIETTGGEGNDNSLRIRGRTTVEVEDAVKSTEKQTEKDDESGSTPIPKNKGKQNNTNEQNAVPVEKDSIAKVPVEVITKEEDKTNNTMEQTDEEGKQKDTDKKKKDPTINDIINHEEALITNLRRRRSFKRLTGSNTASFVESSERRHQ